MSISFHIEANAGAGRAGKLVTPHGEVETPVFMPVGTLGSVKGVSQDLLEELGVQILLGNTYHLYLRPGVEVVRRMGGLHRFMAWPRAILTDSGGFQVFSLNELRKVTEEGVRFRSHLDGSSHFLSPERAMEIQIGLGADIVMAFDECTEYPADTGRARASMEMTLRWAERSKKYFEEHKSDVPWASFQLSAVSSQPSGSSAERAGEHEVLRSAQDDNLGLGQDDNFRLSRNNSNAEYWAGKTQALFGIVQGGMDRELRRESALRTVEIGFPGYAIGGLSVGEPRELTREIVESTLEHLPKEKPRYLMGVGTPEEIALYARLGVDMMDCVLPTRAARHGLLYTSEGRISIKQARYAEDAGPLDPMCSCAVCSRYSRAYLRHLYAANELLAQVLNTIHNLHFYLQTMRRVRAELRGHGQG
ncbi:MAG: tRNA guanosine(34) transglycosylase Tgt [Terriglobales bacterium]